MPRADVMMYMGQAVPPVDIDVHSQAASQLASTGGSCGRPDLYGPETNCAQGIKGRPHEDSGKAHNMLRGTLIGVGPGEQSPRKRVTQYTPSKLKPHHHDMHSAAMDLSGRLSDES